MEKAAHHPEMLDFILYSVSGLYLGLFSEGRDKCILCLEIRVCMDLDGQGFGVSQFANYSWCPFSLSAFQ